MEESLSASGDAAPCTSTGVDDVETSAAAAFERYVEALKAAFPAAAKQLRKGLDAASMASALDAREIDLPPALRALYGTFDGQKSLQLALVPPPARGEHGLALAPLEFLGSWRDNQLGMEPLYRNSTRRSFRSGADIREAFWRPGWLPFAAGRFDREGVHLKLFFDGEPTESGRHGQIVFESLRIAPEAETVERIVVASSLEALFREMTDALVDDRLVWVERVGLRWR